MESAGENTGNQEDNSLEQKSFLNRDSKSATAGHTVKGIWAIGGGKGGVGKSLVAANLAIGLARAGNRVCAVDLDLGCANLHTCLGVEIPQVTLSDFFSKRIHSMEEVLVPTEIKNLHLISGAQDALGVANLKIGRASCRERV